jgi:hypothetical protein
MQKSDDLQYLVWEGNLRVPSPRYGHDIESCARVALAALDVAEQETGSVTTQTSST